MAPKTKSLVELIQDGTFIARRASHCARLETEPPVPWPGLAALQHDYRLADNPRVRQAIARDFEYAVREAHALTVQKAADDEGGVLAEMAKLGRPHSALRLERMFPAYFRHYQGPLAGEAFELERFQQRILRKFFERDKAGRRKFMWLLIGAPRGCGKTPLLAGLGYDGLFARSDNPQVYTVAGSKEQARLGMEFATEWREASPELQEWTRAGAWNINCPGTGGNWRILSSDGRLGHGRNPTRGQVDEWWVIESAREEQSVIALLSGLHKRDGDFIASTTSGYDKTTQLGVEYDAMMATDVRISRDGCLTIAQDLAARKLMFWWGAPDEIELDRDAVLAGEHDRLLRACNPLSSLSLDALRGQFALLPFDEACRLHLNRWTKAKDAWLPAGIWNGLRSDTQIPAGADIYVAVDAALKYDTTAVTIAARLENGRIALQSRVWSARENAPHHVYVPGGRIDNELVESYIAETLARKYRIREVVYDPRYFDTQGARLANAGLIVAEFAQNSAAMADAWQHFYEAAGGGEICHQGDPVFSQHVEAAAAVMTERGWKVYKLKSSSPIDALTAAAMARERASRQTQDDEREYVFDLRVFCACGHAEGRHDQGFVCKQPGCPCLQFEPAPDTEDE